MASKSDTVQHVKAIGKYKKSQISEALYSLGEEQKQLRKIMKAIYSRLQNVSNVKVEGPKQRKVISRSIEVREALLGSSGSGSKSLLL